MTPEILSLSGFAQLQGVRPSYITKLKGDGRLVLTDDGKVRVAESMERIKQTAGGRIDVSARHAAARAAGGDEKPLAVPNEGTGEKTPQNAKAQDGSERLVDAKLRKESAQADQEEMKAAQMRGELIPREAVDDAMKFIGGAVRAALDVFPDQTAPIVAPISDLAEIHETLTQACRDALHGIGETIERKKKELSEGGN